MSASTDVVAALQRTLAGEHAAIYVLATLAGRASTLTAPALRDALDTAYGAHVGRRDQLRRMVAAAGAAPVAASPAYRLTEPLRTAEQIRARALSVEESCATTYAALVAATSGDDRGWAIGALVATAVGETAFGGLPQALPGFGRRG